MALNLYPLFQFRNDGLLPRVRICGCPAEWGLSPVLVTFAIAGMGYGVHVDRAKCGFCFRVCRKRDVRSAALGDQKDFIVVLNQKGRAKNPALLIF
jgi:hypothetical protein